MGCLAWLRYLSHTQVIESSNLSPSINHSFRGITMKISKEKMSALISIIIEPPNKNPFTKRM
jgi:hypothetical protein